MAKRRDDSKRKNPFLPDPDEYYFDDDLDSVTRNLPTEEEYLPQDEEPEVPADTTLAVIEYAAKPFFGKDTTYTVALYQAKEGASITDNMWSYKKTPASKDETLERVATVTIVTANKTGEVLSYESEAAE